MDFSKCFLGFGHCLKLLNVGVIALGVQSGFTHFAFANSEVPLLKLVPTKHDGDPSELRLWLDDQFRLISIRYYLKSNSKSPLRLNKEMQVNELASTPVILRQEGVDIMKLESHDLTPQSGGHIIYHYLLDGFDSLTKFGEFSMELIFDASAGPRGSWKLKTQENKELNQLNLTMKRNFMHMVVGIADVAPSLESSALLSAVDLSCPEGQGLSLFDDTSRCPVSQTVEAAAQPRISSVLHVTSDAMDGYLDLQVETDANSDLVSIRYLTSKGVKAEFKIDQLKRGFVIYQESGYDIVKLQSDNFNAHSGGPINLVYLINGIWGSHGTFVIDLVRQRDSWFFEANDQSGHHKITQMFLKKNTVWGKTVGLSGVEVH